MKIKLKSFILLFSVSALTAAFSACSDDKSYADLLTEETHAVNYFLADYEVINQIPADSVFEFGEDAPYYRLDETGNMYMQVIDPGTNDNKAQYDEQIYFRFTRYNLGYWMDAHKWVGSGNANDLTYGSTSFRFANEYASASSTYGLGVQEPLKFFGVDCVVNIVIKSQLGPANEIASVVPYMYNLRYYRSPL